MKREDEVFKPIIGYEGYYEVSNHGRIKSLAKKWVAGNGSRMSKGESYLKAHREKNGYMRAVLCVDKIKKIVLVHMVVAKHFCDNPNNLPWVNHENSVRDDNYYENLTWTTPSGNRVHGIENGFVTFMSGEKNGNSKLVKDDILKIKNLYKSGDYSQSELSKIYNVGQTQISRIILGKRWSHI